MKRVVYIQGQLQQEKFILQREYEGFGLYQRMTPNGWMVHQEWLITNEEVTAVFYSYMNYCEEEVLDAVDNYKSIRKFGVKAFKRDKGLYVVHLNGDVTI